MQRSKEAQAKDIIKALQDELRHLDREMSGILRDEVMKEIVRPYTDRIAAKLADLRSTYGILSRG